MVSRSPQSACSCAQVQPRNRRTSGTCRGFFYGCRSWCGSCVLAGRAPVRGRVQSTGFGQQRPFVRSKLRTHAATPSSTKCRGVTRSELRWDRHASKNETRDFMDRFDSQPGNGIDDLALARLRRHFHKPVSPMGAAWFMGERRIFDELRGDLSRLGVSKSQAPLREIASSRGLWSRGLRSLLSARSSMYSLVQESRPLISHTTGNGIFC